MNATSTPWMIYGAYGFSGRLIAEEAARRGHRPILAGRDAGRLLPLAERLRLPHLVVNLDEPNTLVHALEGVGLVLHTAGPFVRTSAPMLRACLETGACYLDITGEISVFEAIFARDEVARRRGIALMPGVGFDVVPTDCLARYVSERVPGATELELAVAETGGGPSAGTLQTVLEQLPRGGLARRGGALVPMPLGRGARRHRFVCGERSVLPIPWGDLATAWRTTGIPNITTYLAYPPRQTAFLGVVAPLLQRALSIGPVLRAAQNLVGRTVRGPSEARRSSARSHAWARAADGRGAEAQAWIEGRGTHWFTTLAALRCVERVLAERPVGAITPAGAFGADLVLEVEGTRRFDTLP